MKAILARAFGGPEVLTLEDVPDPSAGQGQVRVRIHAVGVNPYDTYMRAGGYAITPDLPYTPGADAAGVIDQVGDGVAGWGAGDRVYISGTATGKAHGAYAAIAVCEAAQVHRLPARISFAQGAGLFVPYVTAWRALFGRANARAGDTVLVHGASGGVGIAATQFAVAAGLTVIGTAGTDEGLAVVTRQGARHAFNHRSAGYLDQITSATGGRGPDVILEMLANVNLDHDLTIVAPGGRIVVIGNRGRVEIDARKIMGKDCAVYGMALWGIPPDEVRRAHQAISAGLDSGTLNPVVGKEMPLADAAKAHVAVMAPGAHGKIVLIP
ncbi:MAG: quinone oxidoreductase [Acidobacterium sp.]|nr:NADPH:quinone reductase [Acidobacteriota bacterium]PHY08842.1 MAG: quinone oxidoreductase [Acidobacterium sp.]